MKPQRLDDIIGHRTEVQCLRELVATKDNILITGPIGVGKTTLARCFIRETGLPCVSAKANKEWTTRSTLNLLSKISTNGLLYIDELQRIPAYIQKGIFSKKIKNAKFRFVGTTTRKELIGKWLVDFFSVHLNLHCYSIRDLQSLLDFNCSKLGVEIETPVLDRIARQARGSPREANRLFTKYAIFLKGLD